MAARSTVVALLAAVSSVLLISGCQSLEDEDEHEHTQRTASPVLGGVDDTTHEQVVSIMTVPDAPSPELCTGVVVGARVVLTAGHCVQGQTTTTLQVGFGPSASAPTRVVAITTIAPVPRFTGDLSIDKPLGHDLGVVILAEDAGVVPIALGHAAPAVGGLVRLVGFGLSSAIDVETRGKRRMADVRLGASCTLLVDFGDLATNACHGDSGGPLLRMRADGIEEVIGIVSYGRTASCDPPSYAVRVDAYADWIANVIAGGAPSDCAKCPAEPIDCPPPLADAGFTDATSDASSTDASDAGDASPADASSSAPSSGGGCAFTGSTGSATAWFSAVLLTLGVARRQRRGRGKARRVLA